MAAEGGVAAEGVVGLGMVLQAHEGGRGGEARRCSVQLQARAQGMVLGRVCSFDAGCHLLHLRLGGEALGASPYRVHVAPAAAYAPACLLTADAAVLREVRTGAPFCVRLLPRDRYGNARPVAEAELGIFVRGAARPLAQQVRCVGAECLITLALPLSGEYELDVRVRKASACTCMCARARTRARARACVCACACVCVCACECVCTCTCVCVCVCACVCACVRVRVHVHVRVRVRVRARARARARVHSHVHACRAARAACPQHSSSPKCQHGAW